MKLLQIDSSILGAHSTSRALTKAVVDSYQTKVPGLQVTRHDFGVSPLPHISPETLSLRGVDASQLSDGQRQAIAHSDQLIRELKEADVLVIGAPLYNFSIPTGLKAWIDYVSVAGQTFKYTDKGPVGLVPNKKAIIVATSGGVYGDTPISHMHAGYVKTVLNFLGVTDVEIIRAEGLNMGEQPRQTALDAAHSQIAKLAA